MTENDPWRKPSEDMVARFQEAVAGLEGVEVRKMFGFPAAFVGGNMTAGLHGERMMVRLAEHDRAECLADGWTTFSPMPGREMREYVTLPIEVADDCGAAREWIIRAAAYVRTLPPKAAKAPKAGKARKARKGRS